MNFRSSSIAVCVAAALAATGVAAESPDGSLSPVLGEAVDADVPAMYRLPLVREAARETPGRPLMKSPLFGAPVGQVVPIEPVEHPPGPSLEGMGMPAPVHGAEVEPQVEEAKPQAEIAPETKKRVEMPVAPSVQPRGELTTQLLPAVQRGFGLAQRGALYAARTEFVQVLRRVAQARDAAGDTSEHSRALAAGLRALDEAEDFVPEGVQLEAELDVRTTASSHRTNVLPEVTKDVSPLEALALYHEFAQGQLKKAVVDEQAGSMALYGLGTIYSRLAARNDDEVQLTRNAITMYAAALDACPNNHLAANELGVLICRSGRANEAAALFKQSINFAPSAVAYHNLAIAQQRSGLLGQAAANELESQRLAALERARGDVSRRAGVHWVTPEEMARASQPIHRAPTMPVQQPAMAPQQAPPAKSTWQRVVDSTRAIPLPGRGAKEDLGPMPSERIARPSMTGTGNQSQWR
jgi:tetratricopeptide (TPR) repeat protein